MIIKNGIKLKLFQYSRRFFHDQIDVSKDHYRTLGINHSASIQEIKDSYYKLAKKNHPDLNKGISTDKFKEITEAYEILSDSNKKKAYDLRRGLNTQTNNYNQHRYKNNENGSPFGAYSQNFRSSHETYYNTFNQKRPNPSNPREFAQGRKSRIFNEQSFENFDDFIRKTRWENQQDVFNRNQRYSQREKEYQDFYSQYQKENINQDYYKQFRSTRSDIEEMEFQYQRFRVLRILKIVFICSFSFLLISIIAMKRNIARERQFSEQYEEMLRNEQIKRNRKRRNKAIYDAENQNRNTYIVPERKGEIENYDFYGTRKFR